MNNALNNKLLKIAVYIFFLSIGIFSLLPNFADSDLWGRLLYGQDMLKNMEFPRSDIYSFTAEGSSWTDHEWLSEMIFYVIFKYMDSIGLVTLKILIAGITFFLIFKASHKRCRGLFIPLCLFFLCLLNLYEDENYVRPALFTALFFSIFQYLFILCSMNKERVLFFAPIIMLFWVNLHGGFVAGFGTLFVFTFSKVVDHRHNAFSENFKNNKFVKIYIPVLVISTLITLVNPYGFGLWKFLFNALILSRKFVTDWVHIPIFNFEKFEFKILLCVLFVALVFTKEKRVVGEILIIAFSAVFGFLHSRHISLFAISAVIFGSSHIESVVRDRIFKQFKWRIIDSRIYLVISLCLILFSFYFIKSAFFNRDSSPFEIMVNHYLYPVDAVNFMKKNEINGNIASNQYGWGEYVLYKMYPKSRIAFDGRFETVYSLELHRAYFNLFSGKNGWRELLDKYNTDIALVQKGIPGTAEYLPSYGLLKQESDWVLVYEDDNSAVFIKTNEKNREILARYERNQLLITAQSVVSYFP